MHLWHGTPDAQRPERVAPGQCMQLEIGTWPIEPGQSAWVEYVAAGVTGTTKASVDATWVRNSEANSYWRQFGPFEVGTRVHYTVRGRSGEDEVMGPSFEVRVAPRLYLAILWHQHQPLYRPFLDRADGDAPCVQPWVRLHALRDYYSMAALIGGHPDLHLTINLTPVLLQQIDDYVQRGSEDRALELTHQPADRLTVAQREELLSSFFDAHWHNQIFPHPRYKELFIQRREGRAFGLQDLRDLQMWFNLAWFAQEFRDADTELVTGEVVMVRRFVEQERGYTQSDIEAMIEEQYKILRAIVPIHRALQERGQIEVSTTPFYHPILPLIIAAGIRVAVVTGQKTVVQNSAHYCHDHPRVAARVSHRRKNGRCSQSS